MTDDTEWEEEREELRDIMANRHEEYLRRSEWAMRLAADARNTGCHRAAVDTSYRAQIAWIRVRETLEDFDYERDRPHLEAHQRMADNLRTDRALAWMDHVLGPGWLEAGE